MLAEVIRQLIDLRRTGVINVAGERVSRYEVALKVAEMYNLDRGKVREVDEVKG